MAESVRPCKKCGEPARGRRHTCARCVWLKHKYDIDNRDYMALFAEQRGLCGFCERPCPTGKRLALDHDHACCPGEKTCGKCIRGLLCYPCNCYLIGMYERLPAALRDWPRLDAYLEGRILN